MITLLKVLSNDNPESLKVIFDNDVVPSYDSTDFIVIQNAITYNPTVSVVDARTYILTFSTTDKTAIDFTANLAFVYDVLDTLNIVVAGSQSFVYNNLPLTVSTTPDPNSGTSTDEAVFSTVINPNNVEVTFDSNISAHKTFFKVKVTTYDFYMYGDFADDIKEITTFTDSTKANTIIFDTSFIKDKIYSIDVIFDKTDVTIPVVPTTKNFKHISGKPSLYFTSKYHINRLLDELELKINIVEDFDLKLLIWKYSQLAYGFSGLALKDLGTLKDYEEVILSNYVSYKIILTKFTSMILSGVITQSPSVSTGTGDSDLKLGDYEVKDGNSEKRFADKLGKVAALIKELENSIKSISNSRAFGSYESNKTLTNRPDLLASAKATNYPGKKSERVSNDQPIKANKRLWGW